MSTVTKLTTTAANKDEREQNGIKSSHSDLLCLRSVLGSLQITKDSCTFHYTHRLDTPARTFHSIRGTGTDGTKKYCVRAAPLKQFKKHMENI